MDATALLGDPVIPNENQAIPSGQSDQGFQPDILRVPPRVRLVQLARQAAQETLPRVRSSDFSFRGDGPFSSAEILAILTFSYGTGSYTLERIYDALRNDVLYRSFIGQEKPHPETIRAFRRQQREPLKESLKRFFELARLARDEEATSVAEAPETCPWSEALHLPGTLPDCDERLQRLIDERVNQATWIDRMMLDY